MYDSRDYTWGVTGRTGVLVYRYKTLDQTDIDVDLVLQDVIDQVNFNDRHPFFTSLLLNDYKPKRVGDAPFACDVTLSYGRPENNQQTSGGANDDDELWEWDMNAQQVLVQKASDFVTLEAGKKQYGYSCSASSTPALIEGTDAKLELNEDVAGNAQGGQIYAKAVGLRVTKVFQLSEFNATQRNKIQELQGTVNGEVFAEYPVGTVLFLGATMSYNYNTNRVSVVYTFIISSVRDAVSTTIYSSTSLHSSISATIKSPDDTSNVDIPDNKLLPFDTVWFQPGVLKASADDPTFGNGGPAGEFVEYTKTIGAYVGRPYDWGDFAELDLGSGPA